MDESKAKREARRRKILENSEKRLEKIARAKYDADDDERTRTSDQITTSRLVPEPYGAPASHLREDLDVPFDETNENERLRDTLNALDECTVVPTTKISNSSDNMKIWKKLGFKLVVLAIVVRIVHIFKLGYLFGETIVLPFALFMMTQLGSCQFDQNTAGITGPILYFIGMSPTRIKNLLICYNVVSSILVYFGIYFFTFVCTHLTFVKVLGL